MLFRNRTAVAVAFVIGILVLGGVIGMSSYTTTPVSAAQIANHGGATDEMLAFALNFKRATDFEVAGSNGFRNAAGSSFGANAIDPQVSVDLENSFRAIG
ncbi:MAG: hypothetical protein ABJA02_03230, partial [Acidobacteriota bacterium]